MGYVDQRDWRIHYKGMEGGQASDGNCDDRELGGSDRRGRIKKYRGGRGGG